MNLQHMIFTVLLLLLGLLDTAIGVAVGVDDHPALPRGPCSYTTNAAGIVSVICHFPTHAPDGRPSGHAGAHSSGISNSPLAARINTSWTPVTETYTTTSVDVLHPVNRTQTYTHLSTELTSTTLDMKTATQTIVEIAGYSTIGTYTTTFLAPISSSSYSAIRTVTTTSTELLVPSSGTLTLTGHLPPSTHSFPTLNAQKRGLSCESTENRTGIVLAYRSPAMSSGRGYVPAEPAGVSPDLTAATVRSVPFLSDGADPFIQAESAYEHTKSSSTDVLVITVTNTYFVTRTSEHKHKTSSSSTKSTTWLIGSPTASNATHNLPTALTMHNTSAVTHATTMMPELSSIMFHTTSVASGPNIPTEVTGNVSPTSTSGGSVILNGLALHVFLAVLAMRLLFVA